MCLVLKDLFLGQLNGDRIRSFLDHRPADPVAPFKSKYLHVCKCFVLFCMHSFLFYPHECSTFLLFLISVWSFLAVPLYQDYCHHAVEDLPGEGLVPEPITSESILALQGIRFRAKFQVIVPPPQVTVLPPQVIVPPPQVTVAPPPPARFPRDRLTTFWQDLDEVKECGVLATLSPREVHRQEVGVCLSCLSCPCVCLTMLVVPSEGYV